MRRWFPATTICLAASLFGMTAHAQDFAKKGTWVFGVDRVLGFTHSRLRINPDTASDGITVKSNNLGLIIEGDVVSPYSNPRFAFDYNITGGLTVGGTLGYWLRGGETVDENTGDSTDSADQNMFEIAARVGYAFMFNKHVGIWPRGGFTVYTGEVYPANNNNNIAGFGMNIDVPFVFVPMEHFGILAGPGLDYTLVGGYENDAGDHFAARFFDVGVHIGFVGYI